MVEAIGLTPVKIADVPRIEVGPGCYRRDLPSRTGMRMWVVEMDPGAEWPHLDQHKAGGEDVFVASGAMIEGSKRYEAGTYLHFGADSSHRPRTDVGVTLYGINLL